MKRAVSYVRLHDLKVVIPGIGQLETEFPPQRKTLPGLKMWWDGLALEVCIAGKYYGIPASNVQFVAFVEPETVSSAHADSQPDLFYGDTKITVA